jgi:hypothetical protein
MKKFAALFLLSIFILLFLSACHKAPKTILLRLKYFKRQRIDVKYRSYVYADDDMDHPLTNEYTRLGFTVDSILPDSSYKLGAKIDYVRVKNGGLFNEEYSSDREESEMSPNEKQIHQMVKPLLDSAYTFSVSNRGKILASFSFSRGKNIPRQFALIDLPVYQLIFPQEKLAIGDEWTTENPVPQNKGKRIFTYTIEGEYDSAIQINVKGKLELPNGGSKNFTGHYALDKETNAIISGKIETDFDMSGSKHIKAVVSVEAH